MFSKLYTNEFFEVFTDATKEGFGTQEIAAIGSLILQLVGNETDVLNDVLAITYPMLTDHPEFDTELYNINLDWESVGPIPLEFDHEAKRLVGPGLKSRFLQLLVKNPRTPGRRDISFSFDRNRDGTATLDISEWTTDKFETIFEAEAKISRQNIIDLHMKAAEYIRVHVFSEENTKKGKLLDKQNRQSKKHRSG